MKRKIAAVLAFNTYALASVVAFSAATPFVFHGRELANLKDQGIPFNPKDWGFDDHYLWRLFAAAISTAIAGFICGAFARQKGSKVALLANIPSVIGWIAYAWILYSLFDRTGIKGDDRIEGPTTAYGVVSIIAIPLTCWLAMKFGGLGERTQVEHSKQDRTLGVADWHWAWMWLPLSQYGYMTVAEGTNTNAKVGVVAGIFNLGAGGASENKQFAVNRVQFSVPILFPASNLPEAARKAKV